MSVLIVISAHQEWKIVRDRYPESDIQESPYGQFFRSAIGGLSFSFTAAGERSLPPRVPNGPSTPFGPICS